MTIFFTNPKNTCLNYEMLGTIVPKPHTLNFPENPQKKVISRSQFFKKLSALAWWSICALSQCKADLKAWPVQMLSYAVMPV